MKLSKSSESGLLTCRQSAMRKIGVGLCLEKKTNHVSYQFKSRWLFQNCINISLFMVRLVFCQNIRNRRKIQTYNFLVHKDQLDCCRSRRVHRWMGSLREIYAMLRTLSFYFFFYKYNEIHIDDYFFMKWNFKI